MPSLSVRDLTFTYAHGASPALRAISFDLEAGQVTAIVGANGAGKSTLCFALGGYIPHLLGGRMSGSVRVNGGDTRESTLDDLVTQVGLVVQNPFNQISGARQTVAEEVAFGLENLGVAREEMHSRVDRALKQFGLENAALQSPYNLSGGQQQRLALASIVVMEPDILLLDEPTAQLDPAGTHAVMSLIGELAAQGRTLVLVEHKLEWIARLAARVLVLDRGELVADGTPHEVLPRAQAWGLSETRYTRAARRARDCQLVSGDQPLPLTLEEAKQFFKPFSRR